MKRWRLTGISLSIIGAVVALYLLAESLYPTIPLYCPRSGVIDCGAVTSSSFSKFAGIPVAGFGLVFFLVMLSLMFVDNPTLDYLLLPLWAAGVAFVGYLVYAEIFVLGAICLYCTVDHIVAVLLVLPAVKLALGGDT